MGITAEIIEFSEAEKALQYVKSPDDKECLILLDINMPVMNGWDFLASYISLQGRNNETVIMLSSSIDHHDRQRSQAFSCVQDFIEKPLTREKLAKALKKEL